MDRSRRPSAPKKTRLDELDSDLGVVDDGYNWKSIVFSLLVIGTVIAGIVTAIYLLGYVDELLYWSGKRMTLDEYLQGELTPTRLNSQWTSSKHFVFQQDDGGLAVLDASDNTVSLLVTNHTLRQLDVKGFQCTADLRYILFRHDVKTTFHFDNGKRLKRFAFEQEPTLLGLIEWSL
ncbi:hypothetical protein RUM43_008878 [Polyplax serrata]|uniref:Transmembrane protein n=1 Tax=Polyplax serrata TaxID=468196 RepID=A0AAN8S0T4_POLSC